MPPTLLVILQSHSILKHMITLATFKRARDAGFSNVQARKSTFQWIFGHNSFRRVGRPPTVADTLTNMTYGHHQTTRLRLCRTTMVLKLCVGHIATCVHGS